MEKFEICGEKVKTEEDRQLLLDNFKNDKDDFDTSQDALQLLTGSCTDFKKIHPMDASKYHKEDTRSFLAVINYHIDIQVQYNEYGYSLKDDCRIIIMDT